MLFGLHGRLFEPLMKFTLENVGCHFDGTFGFEYNALRLLDFAEEVGFKLSEEWGEGIHEDHLPEMCDEAIDWLNENLEIPDNTAFAWESGDFGLWWYCPEHPDEPCAPMDCPLCE